MAQAIFAGGCFWCTEAVFRSITGVSAVESGYIGGTVANPTYKQVCSGDTGHAEAIRIEFDPAVVSYADLLDIHMGTHDPTQLNRQGNDIGTQYRTALFPLDDEQRAECAAGIARWNAASGADSFPNYAAGSWGPAAARVPAGSNGVIYTPWIWGERAPVDDVDVGGPEGPRGALAIRGRLRMAQPHRRGAELLSVLGQGDALPLC